MADAAAIEDALRNAHKAGDTDAARKLADALVQARGQKQEPSPNEYRPGAFSSGAQGIFSGVMGGFDDEIAGAVFAPVEATKDWIKGDGFDLKRGYERIRDIENQRKQQRREDHPYASIAGEVLGGLGLGGVASKGGLTTIGRMAPVKGAALEGAGYGALYGAGEADPGERMQGAAVGGLVGGATGALAGKIGQSIANRGTKTPLQTSDALRAQKNALYDASEQAGVLIKPQPLQRAVQNLRVKMAGEVQNERLYAQTRDILGYLDDATKRGPMTLKQVDELRQVVGDTITDAPAREKRTLMMVKESIDDFLDNLSPGQATGGGATKQGVELLKQARAMNVMQSKQGIVEQIFEKARNQATGFENGLRVHFRALANNPKKFAKFSKAEQDAIRKIVRGGPIENSLRAFAWLSPQKTLGAVMTGITAAEGGMGPASAMAGLGMAATRGAERATRGNVNTLERLIQGQTRRDMPLLMRQAIPAISGLASRETVRK